MSPMNSMFSEREINRKIESLLPRSSLRLTYLKRVEKRLGRFHVVPRSAAIKLSIDNVTEPAQNHFGKQEGRLPAKPLAGWMRPGGDPWNLAKMRAVAPNSGGRQ